MQYYERIKISAKIYDEHKIKILRQDQYCWFFPWSQAPRWLLCIVLLLILVIVNGQLNFTNFC
jgi:hypothetical protein